MERRDFLKGMAGILAAGFAPAAIGSNILMPVRTLALPDWNPLLYSRVAMAAGGVAYYQTGDFVNWKQIAEPKHSFPIASYVLEGGQDLVQRNPRFMPTFDPVLRAAFK